MIAGWDGLALPVPMRNVLNERVDKNKPSYKIIWGETDEAMAKRIVECLLAGLGPVLLPINQKNHWILIYSAKTDARGSLDYVGVRDPVTVNPPPFDPTAPKYDHTPVLDDQSQIPGPDPCRHDAPHIQERRLDVEGLLQYLTPVQWGYQVFRNLAIVPVAVLDLAAE